MSDMDLLRDKKPEMAKFLEQWKKKYENKSFDLKDEAQAATFYEAMLEVTRAITGSSQNTKLTLLTNNEGINTLYVHVTPLPLPPSSSQ
jgi:hypothetical protein